MNAALLLAAIATGREDDESAEPMDAAPQLLELCGLRPPGETT